MKPSRKRLLLFTAALLLGAGISVQIYARIVYQVTSSLGGRELGDLLPRQLVGWSVDELPIAKSEAAVGNVEKILQYDGVVFRRYTRGQTYVDVYVAYWLPGKMSYWDVGSHNPDSCWVYNGFVRQERVFGMTTELEDFPLKPFEFGRYEHGHNQVEVMFWHLVGGKPNRYEEQPQGWRNGLAGRIERFPLIVGDIKNHGLDLHREQFFIRISSNAPLRPMLQDEDFRNLLAGMEDLGIFQR